MVTLRDRFTALKKSGRKAAWLTVCDYPTSRLLDEAGLDCLLVGDSLGMVALGYPDTTLVTLADMLHHTRVCRRAITRTPLAADLPYRTYETRAQALETANALAGAGAEAVKFEGGRAFSAQARAITGAGLDLVGHIGMLPQSVREDGGYKKKGKTREQASALIDDARSLDEAGACAIVLEGIMPDVAAEITAAVSIPTIGIGSGTACDGQILVTHDLTGAFPWFRPPFAKVRGDVAGEIRKAAAAYAADVRGTGA